MLVYEKGRILTKKLLLLLAVTRSAFGANKEHSEFLVV